ncbi:hypothetical protein ACXZ7R_17520 [Vibrio campbellii]
MEEQMMKALFAQQRAQIIFMKAQQPDLISDAYAHAWLNGVYPFLHDGDDSVPDYPHENFSDYFNASAEFGLRVLNYLADLWDEDNCPTFYELEGALGGREVRAKLINICRYIRLDNRFDSNMWETLTRSPDCPAESSTLIRQFSLNELYIG